MANVSGVSRYICTIHFVALLLVVPAPTAALTITESGDPGITGSPGTPQHPDGGNGGDGDDAFYSIDTALPFDSQYMITVFGGAGGGGGAGYGNPAASAATHEGLLPRSRTRWRRLRCS